MTFLANPSGSKGTSEKVLRWRLYIQTFDFDIEHIAGEENVVADLLSRLVMKSEVSMVAAVEDAPGENRESDDSVYGQVQDIIETCHNIVVGHHGVERTVHLLQTAGHTWTGMKQDSYGRARCVRSLASGDQPLSRNPS